MKYLSINQQTAQWLLLNKSFLKQLCSDIKEISNDNNLSKGVLSIGPIRITSDGESIISIWNSDYLSETGYEDWALLLVNGQYGFNNSPSIMEEVFERMINIVNQRFQGLLLPHDLWIHRSIGNNIHTCLSGRGDLARKCSIGWYENNIMLKENKSKILACIGPIGDSAFETIVRDFFLNNLKLIFNIIEKANILLEESYKKPIVESKYFSSYFQKSEANHAIPFESLPELEQNEALSDLQYKTFDWDYSQWISEGSCLTKTQRLIIESNKLSKQPLRIMGAAGSGKSLLMQLLAMQRLVSSRERDEPVKILYIVHNKEMERSVEDRFVTLGAIDFMLDDLINQRLVITTLFEHCIKEIDLPMEMIIEKDASQTKKFQRQKVIESINNVIDCNPEKVKKSVLISKFTEGNNQDLLEIFADIVVSEIGITIKGRGNIDKKVYIESEKPFSRIHGQLSQIERELVFEIYNFYHEIIFEKGSYLDSDDIAITYLAHLKTPLWEMKRRKMGFDYVFVDETQLFNQNERQLFRLLTKGNTSYLPIAIALDDAQELRGMRSAGFGLLGFENLENEILKQVHRSTESILKLAFFVIQRTTDLFSSEFPDYTHETITLIENSHKLAKFPQIITRSESNRLYRPVEKEISRLRKENIRTIAVVVHAERYWSEIIENVKKQSQIPIRISERRGELIESTKPIVFITKPDYVGGQEFDAVISVGLEHGVTPPTVNHPGLAETLEQQMLREMYLVFTRARFQLIIVNSKNSMPNSILQSAIKENLIIEDNA